MLSGILSGISIVCFTASYAVSLALEVSRLFFRMPVRLVVMIGFTLAGLLAHTLYLAQRASGAALGFIGGFSYLGAALQDFASGRMIEAGRLAAAGGAAYDFSQVKMFWFGAAVVSLLFALSLWWAEARQRRAEPAFVLETPMEASWN